MKLVKVVFDLYEKGRIIRVCVLFDYGPSRRYKDGKNRYNFYDLGSSSSNHDLSYISRTVSKYRNIK